MKNFWRGFPGSPQLLYKMWSKNIVFEGSLMVCRCNRYKSWIKIETESVLGIVPAMTMADIRCGDHFHSQYNAYQFSISFFENQPQFGYWPNQ